MEEYIDDNVPAMDEEIISIDLKRYVDVVKSNWKKILIWGVSAAFIGAVLSFGLPREYKVISKVAPELSLRSNSLTSLASMAGLNLNMLSNNNDALLPTVYPDIVGSVPFITDLFPMPVKDSTLYSYVLNDMKMSWAKTVMSMPFRAIGNLISSLKNEDIDNSVIDSYHLTKEQNVVYKILRKAIKVEVDKKTFLVTVTVTMQNAVVAADLSNAVIENLKKYVTDYRTDKARTNAEFLQEAFDKAKNEYYVAQQSYASYCDAHQEMLSQSAMIEKQRLQNDSNMKYQLYSSLAQQLQQAVVTVQQESPVFAVVVPPSVPLRKAAPKRSRIAVVFMMLGMLAAFVDVVVKTEK